MGRNVPPLDKLINNYLLCCTTEGKSQKTIDWYSSNLRRFSQFLKSQGLSQSVQYIGTTEVRKFIFHLQNHVTRWEDHPCISDTKSLSPVSIQGYVRTIKAFWSWILAEGYISDNPIARLKMLKAPQKIIATFAPEHIKNLLGTIDPRTPVGFRNYVMVLVLLDTGVRLSELVGLKVDSLDLEESCFLVRGKGNKERIVPFGNQVRRALWRYMASFRPEPYYAQYSQLFLSSSGIPLRPRSVQSMISRLGRLAGITGVRCSPHTFRHSFAKNYLLNGGDVFSLQKILGHRSLEMVKVYVNLSMGDVNAQHRKFSPVDNMQLSIRRQSAKRGVVAKSSGSSFSAMPAARRSTSAGEHYI